MTTTTKKTNKPPTDSRGPGRRFGELIERKYWIWLLILPSLLLVGAVVIYPLLSGIWLSFHEYRLNRPDLGRPLVGFDQFVKLVNDPVARTAMVNTLTYVVVGVITQFVLGLGAALLLYRPFRGVWLARLIVLLPWFLPTVVTAHMWNLMLDSRIGVINDILVNVGVLDAYKAWFADPATALWTVLAVDLWRSFPLFALFLIAGLIAIPEELDESAALDGANAWHRFRYIHLPLLTPVIVVATVLQVIRLANIPDLLIVLTGGGPANSTQVLSLYAFLAAYSRFDFGYAAAISVALLVFLLGFSIVYIRVSGVDEA